MRRVKRSSKPGHLRWAATGFCAALLVGWLASAWWIEVAAAASPGKLSLRSGCLVIGYQLHQPPPPNVNVTTILDWPATNEYGVSFPRLQSRGIRWTLDWPAVERVCVSSIGSVSVSGTGPSSIITMSSASFYTEKMLPLWPLVLVATLAAGWTWTRHFRRGDPGKCTRCGYDRHGLAADAPCPECGTVPAPAAKEPHCGLAAHGGG
jgi:hypothetical protein